MLNTIENLKMEDHDMVFKTNVQGVVMLTHIATPYLISSKGNIINVSSTAGSRPVRPYSMALWGSYYKCLDVGNKKNIFKKYNQAL